ncbi:MAG: aryl-sulfate sulfotransferase [Bacteroidia bacterium]
MNTGKFILLLIVFTVCTFRTAFSQSYPAFSVTAYDSASEGYYFIIPVKTASSNAPVHMIVDSVGHVVYYKILNATNSGDFRLQPNGLMSYSMANKFYFMDSTFTIVDSVRCQNGITTDTHDMRMLPNGNFLMLGYEYVTMDLSMYNYFGVTHNLPGDANANVRCAVIQELDPNDNVVFEWHSADHFAFSDVDPKFLNSPSNVDWTHSNSLEVDYDGNILMSSRHFDEITKISRTDSSVIWRFGGNANQFTSNDPAFFIGQHDARRIANGHITVNDNGRANPLHYASSKEYQLDENLHTANLVWSYIEDSTSHSVALGNAQRLANGNTVVDYGNTPNKSNMFKVVDPAGNKLFELTFADTLRSYRAYNFHLPWTLDRPKIDCYMVSSQLYLDAGAGHSSYSWSTGDTTQVIPVSAAGTIHVFVADGHGGFISSEYLVIADPISFCNTLGIQNSSSENNFAINPNPVSDELHIELTAETHELFIQLFDATGKCILSKQENNRGQELILPVQHLPAGVYFLMINGSGKKFVKQ